MSRTLRWSLRILGWLLVVIALAPHYESVDEGPGASSRLELGLSCSPLFSSAKTVIHAGVANVSGPVEVKSDTHFAIASWSMLLLLAGALTVTIANRRAPRAPIAAPRDQG